MENDINDKSDSEDAVDDKFDSKDVVDDKSDSEDDIISVVVFLLGTRCSSLNC